MIPRVIVISIEGLPGSLLGPYGANTAITPSINTAAAQGIVLDQCFLDSSRPREMLMSLWTAQHACSPGRCGMIELPGDSNTLQSESKTIWQLLHESNGRGMLFTDCQQTAELAESVGCGLVSLVRPIEQTEPASDASECSIMSLFTEAATGIETQLAEQDSGRLLVWIHSRGFYLPWDVPTTIRERFGDPEGPEPPQLVQPPRIVVDSDTDPDLIVGWGQVAAAQAAVIDQAIDLLRDFLSGTSTDWAWCLVGLGGIPLGEHGRLGPGELQLHGEELHVPSIVVPNPPLPVGLRRAELCQLPDLAATIAELCKVEWPNESWGISQLASSVDDPPIDWPAVHQSIGLFDGSRTWIRVPAWSLALSTESGSQLYVKPDDRWEVCDVSSRCSEIVTELQKVSQDFYQAAQSGSRSNLPSLESHLCNLMR